MKNLVMSAVQSNMGSNGEGVYVSRFPAVKRIDLASLRECSKLLSSSEEGSFARTYGNIRRLLHVDVQESAVLALTRFYDSKIRCFLFKDFQLSPTLEEYGKILNFPQSNVKPYRYQEEYYTDEGLASLLQISVTDLNLCKKKRNHVLGFPQDYFEGLMKTYAKNKDWGLFKQVLALTIFGIVLFPQIERHIDLTAIGVFLAFKDKDSLIDPVPAILADTLSTFTNHYEYKGKKIICSLHMLYAWFLNHVVMHKIKVSDLLGYALNCEVETRDVHEWIRVLSHLDQFQVNWVTQSCWVDKPSVIFRCGSFQNVPLMGTKGCINYNPSLTIRQLGYPMRNAPSEGMLFQFYMYEGVPRDESLFRRVLQSWESVVRLGKKELSETVGDFTFGQWLAERIAGTKLPYQRALPVEEEVPRPYVPTLEDLIEAQASLSRAEEEKKVLQAELDKVMLEKERLKSENVLKAMTIEELNKKLEFETKDKQQMKKYLKGAREEVKRYDAMASEAKVKASKWKEMYEEVSRDKKAAQVSLAKFKRESRLLVAELEDQVKSVKQDRESIEEALKGYQIALGSEQGKSERLTSQLQVLEQAYYRLRDDSKYWESSFMELRDKLQSHEVFIELKNEGLFWKDKFSRLAELADQVAGDVSKKLRKAEIEMDPITTPNQVCKFVEFCQTLMEELTGRPRKATTSKKRNREGELKMVAR